MIEICYLLISGVTTSSLSWNHFSQRLELYCADDVQLYRFDMRGATSLFMAMSLIIFGGSVRIYARNALGPFFKYEVSLQKSHKLITSGPYTFVRHPAYSGMIFLGMGYSLFLITPGAFVAECQDQFPWSLRLLRYYIILVYTSSPVWLCLFRADEEDRLLRVTFGEEWDKWASQTKYKVLPYIF